VVHQHGLASLDDAGRKHDIGNKTFPLEICFGYADLPAGSENFTWTLQIEQQNSGRISSDSRHFLPAAVPVINFQPALSGPNRWRTGADPTYIPLRTATKKMFMLTPVNQVPRCGQPHLRLRKRGCSIGPMQGVIHAVDLLRE